MTPNLNWMALTESVHDYIEKYGWAALTMAQRKALLRALDFDLMNAKQLRNILPLDENRRIGREIAQAEQRLKILSAPAGTHVDTSPATSSPHGFRRPVSMNADLDADDRPKMSLTPTNDFVAERAGPEAALERSASRTATAWRSTTQAAERAMREQTLRLRKARMTVEAEHLP